MKIRILLTSLGLLSVLTLIAGLLSCDSEKEPTPLTNPQPAPTSIASLIFEPEVITIGNLTDTTGPSSGAIMTVDMALDDIVKYYNEEMIIPGITFEVMKFDTQLDPARYVKGYETLMDRGADIIITAVPGVATEIKSIAEADEIIIISLSANKAAMVPPGYVFSLNAFNDELAYTALEWIAQNDDDFPQDRPARIGGASWNEPYTISLFDGAQKYCMENPDQFEWKGSYVTDFSFAWDDQVEALKDCDYIIPPQIMHIFARQYRDAGYSTKFIGFDGQSSFFNMIDKANVWDAIDGMLFFKTSLWWNDDGQEIEYTRNLLIENHPDNAEMVMRSGSGYLAIFPLKSMFSMIADTVEAKGNKEFNSQALYETALSFSFDVGDIQHDFTETKRTSANYIRAYELDAAEKDIFLIDSEWYPLVRLQ